MTQRPSSGGAWPGPLKDAATVARIMEAADYYHSQIAGGQAGGRQQTRIPTDLIKVKNASCGQRRRGEVLEVCDHLLSELDRGRLWFSGAAPSGNKCYGILLRALPKDEIDEAQVSGVCVALVNVTDASHNRASVAADKVVLQSSSDGPIQIVWKPDGTGEKECVVLVENPCAAALPASGSTTTSTTTPGPSDCSGRCKWTWASASATWSITIDGCANTTTTTTTTTTGGPTTTTSTTTPNPCGCQFGSTTTSTTTSTTPAPCICTYPLICGVNNGDCTYTYCANQDVQPSVTCTSTTTSTTTTTTTCDCNTTTTTPAPPSCSLGCDWVALPNGQLGFGWYQTSNGCAPNCPCPPPAAAPVFCTTAHTPCVVTVTPTTTFDPSCTGGCTWWWVPALNKWQFWEGQCFGVGIPCTCVAPSSPGNVKAPVRTPCQSPPTTTTTSTTTPPPACWQCYTTTTTTTTTTSSTTTADPCSKSCRWRWYTAVGAWVQETNNCPSSCPCFSPATSGSEDCEIAETPCTPQTTTTTTTTTTTSTTSTTSTTTTSTTSPGPTTTSTTPPCNETCIWQYGFGNGWGLVSDCVTCGSCTNIVWLCRPCSPVSGNQVTGNCQTPPATGCPGSCPPGFYCSNFATECP